MDPKYKGEYGFIIFEPKKAIFKENYCMQLECEGVRVQCAKTQKNTF